MGFEEAQALFMAKHLASRTGERLSRLERGHRHAESLFLRNVWWPVRGDLNDLHPEYEVADWRGRSYFADFVWLPGNLKLLIEIKGFVPHVRDMDRQKYCNELNRETFLCAMGYQVISFAYDDVEQRPDLCITLLRMVLSRYQSSPAPVSRIMLVEKEIFRLALGMPRGLRPKDIEIHLKVDHKTAVRHLRTLCNKGYLLPVRGADQQRVMRYELARGMIDYLS
ncbi:DUF559 domain-containing protein [Paenibacillus sp. NPDC057934]|uniref:DUF559 domain-containing protein n=1 Tax=Paenibacillus sp. NPDC057934 TaxID=3346282 RepID=UPI0036DD4B7A